MATLSDVDLLARLVSFDTTSRNPNLPLARFLADYLDRPGVEVTELPSPDGEKTNLCVRVGPEPDPAERPGLVLSGHMDVVPADDVEHWESDPFRLADRGERLVARGACDMKGFLALAANLAAEVEPDRLRAPLVLLLTYDEEVGCLGAAELVRSWRGAGDGGPALPRAAVIGEPTELRVVRHHKGHLQLRLAYSGVSAHSAYPHLGESAVEAAGEGIVALAGLRRELEAERVESSEHFPDAPFSTLNVGTVRGGVAINVVPDGCELRVGVRLLPGMDPDAVARRIRAAVGEAPELEVGALAPPLSAPEGAPVFRELLDLTEQAEPAAVSYATDAGWLAELGLDCAVFGPGSIEVAHKPNESVPKADLARAREVLTSLIDRFCRHPREAGA